FLIEEAVTILRTRAADGGDPIEQKTALIGAEREHVVRLVAVARLAAAAGVGVAEAEDELLFEGALDQPVLAEECIELRRSVVQAVEADLGHLHIVPHLVVLAPEVVVRSTGGGKAVKPDAPEDGVTQIDACGG